MLMLRCVEEPYKCRIVVLPDEVVCWLRDSAAHVALEVDRRPRDQPPCDPATEGRWIQAVQTAARGCSCGNDGSDQTLSCRAKDTAGTLQKAPVRRRQFRHA